MQLTNDFLHLEFDDRNGSLISLRNAQSGEEHLPDIPRATLFRMLVPAETWQSRFIEANQQECQLSLNGQRLTLTYDTLHTADHDPYQTSGSPTWESENLSIRVVVTVDLPVGSPEAFLEMAIENHSNTSISEIWFPRLGGWTGMPAQGKTW